MSALDGMLVVDLTSGVSGAYAGKLLGDLGARVILVEPPEGNPLRQRPPVGEGAAYGAWFAHLAGAKESVRPAGEQDARTLLRGLLGVADVLLRDGTSPYEGIVPAGVQDGLVEVDLSAFGRTGPYAQWRGSDIATWAMGGYMYMSGEKTREPLCMPGSQTELHAGVHAAFAALAGARERRLSGRGQRVEVSGLEAVLAAHAWLVTSWAASGQLLDRTTHDLVACKDGWVYLTRIAPNPDIFVLLDRPELVDDAESRPQWGPQVFEMFAEWARDHTAEEITTLAQELRIAVTPVRDARDIHEDVHLAARDWWESGDDAYRSARFPGQPYKLTATPSRRHRTAPAVGAQTDAIRAEIARATRPMPVVGSVVSEPPLRGIRVVEVTQNWAGPVCGRHLADLGADVVKIERATRPATRALIWPGPTPDFGRQPHNRAMYFNEMNRNKRDLVLDLADDAGRDVFLELVRRADVLIENNSARVMPNLALDWPRLQQVNPSLVMVSMAGYGATGPARDWVAYGSNIETTCGLTSVTGYGDGSMYRTGLFYADPVAGIHGAVAVLAALEHVRRTGEGQWIDISLDECGAGFCAESLLDYAVTGNVCRGRANRDPRFVPQGAYRCAGVDDWVAISVQSDEEWPVLARVIGRDDMAEDETLRTLDGRAERHDEIDEAITAWTATVEQYEAAWELQRHGISAAPVLANWQILPDPHIARREFYASVEYPVVGVYPTTTWPWRFSRTPARIARPAPVFGEHNRQVLEDLGLSPERVAALYSGGITADSPAW